MQTDKRARERFYEGFWKMSFSMAKGILKGRRWQGAIHQDAQDIASDGVKLLLRQEARGKGIFGKLAKFTPEEIRGYLSRTISRSCSQRICGMFGKFMESLDAMLEAGIQPEALGKKCLSDPALRCDLIQALEEMREAQRGHYRKLPAGVTPIDCVLDVAMGRALVDGIPLRTIQRYMEASRRELDAKLNWTSPRRTNQPAEPEM